MHITKFRNPWYNKSAFGPQWYMVRNEEKPQEYKGYLVFRYSNPWVDVVKYDDIAAEYVCITQRVTVTNAKQFIDSLEKDHAKL